MQKSRRSETSNHNSVKMQETSIATNDSILLCTLTSLLITYFYNIHVLKNLFLSIFNFLDFPENFLIRTPQILFHRCASYVGFAITSMYNSKKKKKEKNQRVKRGRLVDSPDDGFR